MHVTENGRLLFSSCHLDLVILENSRFFAFYYKLVDSRQSGPYV